MLWLKVVNGLLAALTIGGGLEGFINKGSKGSLFGGLAFGALLIAGIVVSRKNQSLGFGLSAFASLALCGFFTKRYMEGHAVWPAMIMMIAAGLVFLCHVAAHFMKSK